MTPIALALSLALHAAPAPKAAPPKPAAPAKNVSAPTTPEDITAATRTWHEQRLQRLQSEDGWLSLVGLFWLEEGAQTAGSAPENKLDFPDGTPPKLGTFTRKGKEVSFLPEKGVQFTRNGEPFTGGALKTDEQGSPDVLKLGSLNFHVIQRGDKVGVRVKDSQSPARTGFHGIPTYPASNAWRVTARFEPAETPRMLQVPNVLGTTEEMKAPGTLVFTVAGKEYRLTPVEDGSNQLFVIFADETNRDSTYGAGRFLYADMPKDGQVVLDFNRAYNPPCAFTRFATCPLPPRGNRLALRVEAGEKRYGDH